MIASTRAARSRRSGHASRARPARSRASRIGPLRRRSQRRDAPWTGPRTICVASRRRHDPGRACVDYSHGDRSLLTARAHANGVSVRVQHASAVYAWNLRFRSDGRGRRRWGSDPSASTQLHPREARTKTRRESIDVPDYVANLFSCCAAPAWAAARTSTATLYVPPKQFFDATEWAGITDWADELAPYIDQARRMLGVVRVPCMDTDVDRLMRAVARDMGRADSYNRARRRLVTRGIE